MAQSKNNRKKGRKKNNKSHAAQTTKNTVPRMRNWDKEKKIRFACLGIMICADSNGDMHTYRLSACVYRRGGIHGQHPVGHHQS